MTSKVLAAHLAQAKPELSAALANGTTLDGILATLLPPKKRGKRKEAGGTPPPPQQEEDEATAEDLLETSDGTSSEEGNVSDLEDFIAPNEDVLVKEESAPDGAENFSKAVDVVVIDALLDTRHLPSGVSYETWARQSLNRHYVDVFLHLRDMETLVETSLQKAPPDVRHLASHLRNTLGAAFVADSAPRLMAVWLPLRRLDGHWGVKKLVEISTISQLSDDDLELLWRVLNFRFYVKRLVEEAFANGAAQRSGTVAEAAGFFQDNPSLVHEPAWTGWSESLAFLRRFV